MIWRIVDAITSAVSVVPHGKRGTQWRRDVIRLRAERYDVDGLGEMQLEESEIG
jgi:hypothetical protein